MQTSFVLSESLTSLRSNPLRSVLSITGVVFGVASVVTMLAIGLGAEREIEGMLQALGAQNVHITASDLSEPEWQRVVSQSNGLGLRDLDAVRALYPEAETLAVAKWVSTDVDREVSDPGLTVYGMSANFRRVLGVDLLAGRSFTDFEATLGAPLLLVGEELASRWSPDDPAAVVGQELRISRAWFRVIGVLATHGTRPTPDPENERVELATGASKLPEIRQLGLGLAAVTAIASAQRRLGPLPNLSALERIVVKLPTSIDPIAARHQLEAVARRLHRDARVFTIASADEVIEQKRATSRLFSYFLLTVALISLFVGGIGIANVMLASMIERIREVGIKRALGALQRDILLQFLSEALAICLIGGLVGGLAGLGVAAALAWFTGWSVVYPWWAVAVALTIATGVGVASGLYPALLASRIHPIEAIEGRA